MSGNKIFGVILLILGLLIILWGLYSSYNIFKAQSVLPRVFRLDELIQGNMPALEPEQAGLQKFSPEQIQESMQEAVQNQLTKIFPPSVFLKLLNLISWSIFAWILILGGGKIAALGIKLMK